LDIIGVVFIVDIRTCIDDCGRGVMFGGITRIALEGNI
jgi:hypothetical protein